MCRGRISGFKMPKMLSKSWLEVDVFLSLFYLKKCTTYLSVQTHEWLVNPNIVEQRFDEKSMP